MGRSVDFPFAIREGYSLYLRVFHLSLFDFLFRFASKPERDPPPRIGI
jgi:hypothetical protein